MCAFIIIKYHMGAMCVDSNQIPMDGGASNQRLHLLCSVFAYAFHFFKFLLDFKCQCRISVEIFFDHKSCKLHMEHMSNAKSNPMNKPVSSVDQWLSLACLMRLAICPVRFFLQQFHDFRNSGRRNCIQTFRSCR